MTPTPETQELKAAFDNWSPSYGGIPEDAEIALHQAGVRALELLETSEQARQRAETAMRTVALAIGDRTHGAMASECQGWRETLERAALAPDAPKESTP